jgi:hypothetical protein
MIDALFHVFFGAVSGVFWIALTAFWIWMIVDAATREPREGHDRLIWVLITVFVYPIGAIIYYLIRRPERIRAYGR